VTRAVPQASAIGPQATTTTCIRPYDETFVILEGSVRVSAGEEVLDGGPGEVVIGPAGVPRGFTNLGSGPAG
jgi:mannose-6-phosphate isomerase-like protein (cupin superfamily)